jgi:hypothetical protein
MLIVAYGLLALYVGSMVGSMLKEGRYVPAAAFALASFVLWQIALYAGGVRGRG